MFALRVLPHSMFVDGMAVITGERMGKMKSNDWNNMMGLTGIGYQQRKQNELREFELEHEYGDDFRAWNKKRKHKEFLGWFVILIIIAGFLLWFFNSNRSFENSNYEPTQEKVEPATESIQTLDEEYPDYSIEGEN